MENLEGKTAVVTGAASGMGLAFSHRFAQAGMNVVMSDIEAPRLTEAANDVAAHGTRVIGVVTDVSVEESVDKLGATAFEAFEDVHIVCNNAGVAGELRGTGIRAADWKWVLDVNLWGVIHGHRVFLPHLIERGEGHIINTASMAGHIPGHSAYSASKWAVVGITMGLYQQMKALDTGVGVSCLCPGWVNTEIANSDRNRPEWAAPSALTELTAEQEAHRAFLHDVLRSGADPVSVAEQVYDAVVNDKFWIFTDMDMVSLLEDKHDSIINNRNPEVRTLFS
ncbi:MAG: SDR family NAD(P)-dependent oxidoreductase [Acidimicrobiales bacterium]|nr:SDR family NAD(P)-dependent oxidoreductase [Acidimicrobiales bacterium]